MTIYSDREAEKQLASVLERAKSEGEVRIKREDGQEFILKPAGRSALDVGFVDVQPTASDVVNAIRETRDRP